jgi:hypothetical protein
MDKMTEEKCIMFKSVWSCGDNEQAILRAKRELPKPITVTYKDEDILYYFDGPRSLFVHGDNGKTYVAIDISGDFDMFCVEITDETKKGILDNTMFMRQPFFLSPNTFIFNLLASPMILKSVKLEPINEDWLPMPGCFLKPK